MYTTLKTKSTILKIWNLTIGRINTEVTDDLTIPVVDETTVVLPESQRDQAAVQVDVAHTPQSEAVLEEVAVSSPVDTDVPVSVDTGVSPTIPEKTLFRAVLNIFTSKNNVGFVLTDVSQSQIYFKATGGGATKRGTEKNMSKTVIKNLGKVEKAIEELKVDALTIFVSKAHGTMGHLPTTKNTVKLVTTKQWNMAQTVKVYNSTKRKEGKDPRWAGGRRGRRV